jgi:hypothetical protein
MARREQSAWPQAERDLFLTQRALGDVRAAQQGRLPKRIAKRVYHRGVVRLLRKVGLW